MSSIEQLCNENINLVYMIVNKIHSKYNREELISSGMLGLVNGARTYDESKGYKVSTYLATCIRNEINRYIYLENTQKRKGYYEQVSLNTLIGEETELLELIKSEYNLEETIASEENFNRIMKIAKNFLTDIEYKSLVEVVVNGNTLRATAEKLNVSYQTIDDAKKRALNKLRYKLARER